MKPIELVVQALDLTSIDALKAADAIIIGETDYGLRLPYYYSHEELIEAIHKVKANGQKVYLAINKIFHEYELEKLEQYIKTMKNEPIDGFIFGDLGVFQVAESHGIVDRLIYNPETYITNYKSVEFFQQIGIKRTVLAKEITLEDILQAGAKTSLELEVMVHGPLNMFHSKRNLVTNYFRFLNEDKPDQHHNEPLYLVEDKRQDLKYPIIEDQHGTHIYRQTDMCAIEYLDQIVDSGIHALRIDGIFKPIDELKEIVAVYRDAIDDLINNQYNDHKESYIERLKAIPGIRPFDTGFLFEKTVYKG